MIMNKFKNFNCKNCKNWVNYFMIGFMILCRSIIDYIVDECILYKYVMGFDIWMLVYF